MTKRFTLTFTVEQDGILLREAIAAWGISKRALTAIKFDGGQLTVNGVEQNVRYVLAKEDVVNIVFPEEDISDSLIPEQGELVVIYEDDALLVVEKPAFMATIPSREHVMGSLANLIRGHFEAQQLHSTVHIVTRLDRDTSGLVVVAKHRHVHHLMSEQQKRGDVKRQYEAIVEGTFTKPTFSIIEPIGRKDTSIIEREVREDGQFAHTDVEVVAANERFSHIRLTLHTGRTHQIRVHMAHIGHPLVGDELYGGNHEILDRQALHCCSVQFIHPFTKKMMNFTSQMPDYMVKLIQ